MTKFNFTFDPNVSLEQRVGFEMAAAIWSTFLTDDVTVNLRIGATDTLGENGQAVGGAIPLFHETNYGIYQEYLEQDKTSAEDESVLEALQEGNTVDVLVDTDNDPDTPSELVEGNTEIMLTRAQAKALGMEDPLTLDNGGVWDRDQLHDPNGLDGYILINNSYNWHYDLAREFEAPAETLDFLTMALHEIGHSMGFVSGLDGLLETLTLHSGETRAEGITALDLMRYSETSATINNPDGSVSDLSFGGAAYFSIDGGAKALAEFEEGNEYQASHWQRFRDAIGIMDPTLGYQERTDISNLDLTAFDAIGWDVDYEALANGLDLDSLYAQAQQTVAETFGVDVTAVEDALTSGQDWQSLGHEAWFNAFKDQILAQGWGTWFQGFENQMLEQGWGTWFQDFQEELLEQGWGTWFQDFQEELLEQGWGTWFQDIEAQMLEQGWGTWFQAFEDQIFQQMWGTWFQSFEEQLLNQLWGTWFQSFEDQVLEQGWGTWFQNFETQILEQGWGTWFQNFEGDMLNQSWGTWFQSFDVETLNQSWGTWFQSFDAQILEQGWGTWFQHFEGETLEQGWGTWFQEMESQLLEQGWGTWFQEVDDQLLEQGWGTWFQKFEVQVLEQGWGTWFQQIEQHTTTIEALNTALKSTADGSTVVSGGSADDILAGGLNQDLINGAAGDDLIDAKEGKDLVFGDEGNDIIYGWHGEDMLFGGEGDDLLLGENDNDSLYGEAGADILSGGRGDDVLDGGDGRDVLKGDTGNDVLKGGTGDDKLNGGSGQDLVIGGSGKDTVAGDSGDDTLYGDDYFVPITPPPDANSEASQIAVPPRAFTAEDALAALDFRMRLEAEDMKLKNFNRENQDSASGGQVIKTGGQGSATTTFKGPAGTYDLVIGYEDYMGEFAEVTLLIKSKGSQTEHKWFLGTSDGAGTHKIAGVTLAKGDRLELIGTGHGQQEEARAHIDYIDILTPGTTVPADATGTPTGTYYQFVGGNDGQQADIRIEAEDMELGGSTIRFDSGYASGDAVITNLFGDEGTATYTYTGPASIYNLYANYFDNVLGNAEATVLLNGEVLHHWVFDQDDFATHDETLGTFVALNPGDVIQIQTDASWLDRAAIDYLLLEHSSTVDVEPEPVIELPTEIIRIEAESMTLSGNVRFNNESFASGGQLLRTNDDETGLTATTTFEGMSGHYNIVVGYYDRKDGTADYTLTLDGTQLSHWQGSQDLSGSLDSNAATTHTLENVFLQAGDILSLQSIRDRKDRGYFDYIEFVPIGTAEGVAAVSDPLPDNALQIEVEDMDLSGAYRIDSAFSAADRGLVAAQNEVSGFRGSTLFTGETGYYDVVVGYYDTNDGAAKIGIKIDNTQLDSWYADQGLGSNIIGTQTFTTRTVAQGIHISQHDLIELIGINNGGDQSNLDYIRFIKVDAVDEPTPETPAMPEIQEPSSEMYDDILRGGAGNDTAYGGEGNDFISGDAGDDVLYGDTPIDTSQVNLVSTEGLVGHWTFDDGSGSLASDESGHQSGTLTNINLSRDPWVTGVVGGGLNFSGLNDRVIVADSEALDLTTTLTLATWMKADAFESWDGLISKGADNSPYALDLTSDGRLIFAANYGNFTNANGSGNWYSNTHLTTGQWHHVAVTYDGSTIRFYIDGQLDANVVTANLMFGVNDEALAIGADLADGSHFDGTLDDVRIYNRALDNDEIGHLVSLGSKSATPSSPATTQFDGDDAIVHNHTDDMLLNNGTLSFSFQVDNVSNTQGIFSKDSSNYDDGGHFTAFLDNGRLEVRLQSTSKTYFTGVNVEADQLYDVAVTFGSRGLELWLNGSLVDDDSYTGGLGTNSGGSGNREPIVLGASQWSSGDGIADILQNHFSGTLANVRLYDQQLSGDEIAQLPVTPSTSANMVFEELVVIQEQEALVSASVTQFDGDDAIVSNHTDGMLLNNGTLSFAFQAEDVNQFQGLFSKDSDGFYEGGHLTVSLHNGDLVVRLQNTSQEEHYVTTSVEAGRMYDVAVTFGDRGLELWLDGVLVRTNGYTGGIGSSSGGIGNRDPIVLGAEQMHSGYLVADDIRNYFTGTLQNVRLYDQQLSSTEIAQLPTNPFTNANIVFEALTETPQGEAGNDELVGGHGNDTLYGGSGNDILNGTNSTAKGSLEIDHLTGGDGADQFILGDAQQAYYVGGQEQDYAVIHDFTVALDTIQLHGMSSDYVYQVQGGDLFLYEATNLDVIAQFTGITSFNLSASAKFV